MSFGSTSHVTHVVIYHFKTAGRLERWSKEEEVHEVIRFLTAKHVSTESIHHFVEVYGEEVMSRQRVKKWWCADFQVIRVVTEDQERSDRPITASIPANKARVEAAMLENRRVTVSELEHD